MAAASFSGCATRGNPQHAREVQVYAEINFEALRREMAAGEGDYVSTFAMLMGASEETRPAMVRFFKSEYGRLFPRPGVPAEVMLDELSKALARRPELREATRIAAERP